MFCQTIANRLLAFLEQSGRPGVRHVGQNLDPAIAGRRDASDRLFDEKLM